MGEKGSPMKDLCVENKIKAVKLDEWPDEKIKKYMEAMDNIRFIFGLSQIQQIELSLELIDRFHVKKNGQV